MIIATICSALIGLIIGFILGAIKLDDDYVPPHSIYNNKKQQSGHKEIKELQHKDQELSDKILKIECKTAGGKYQGYTPLLGGFAHVTPTCTIKNDVYEVVDGEWVCKGEDKRL